MNINVILPHIKKFGGVRRYLEFGNSLIKLDSTITYNLWLIDYNTDYDWIKELNFRGNIYDINTLNTYDFKQYSKSILICGDATSLNYIERFKHVDLRIINIIFPLNSGYLLGDYSSYLTINDNKTLIIGNSTDWDSKITKQSNYFTIPGAVNTEMFIPKEDNKDNDEFSVLFMAKDRPWKGYSNFLKLIGIVNKTGASIKFGYFDTEKHQILDDMGVTSHINIHQSDMCNIYSKYDCFLSFEKLAGWQNTVAEAMACKCPVITTQVGTLDIAHDKKTALILKRTDNDDKLIEEALTYLFLLRSNKPLRDNLANAGYEHIKKFSWDNYAQQYLDLFNKYDSSSANNLIVLNPQNKPFKIDTPKMIKDTSTSIEDKANELNTYISLFYNSKKSLPFDKYDKFGAYHWESKQDIPYQTYINYLKKTFNSLVEFYGNDYNLIDISGGDGFIAYNIKDSVKHIDLIDESATAINLAQEKLKDYSDKITVFKQNLFDTDLSKYDIVLLSQIIEHFEDPSAVISYLQKFNNKIIIISTPLAKKDGTMWDQNYHYQEFFPSDLIKLISPLSDNYIISLSVIRPHNQLLVLENRNNTINNYIESIFFNEDYTPDKDLLPQICQSLIQMGNSNPKIIYIDEPNEEK